MKRTRELKSSEFPAAAVTVCPNAFAKDNIVNVIETKSNQMKGIPMNLTKDQCLVLTANFHWCHGHEVAFIAQDVCDKFDIEGVNVFETVENSSYEVRERSLKHRT